MGGSSPRSRGWLWYLVVVLALTAGYAVAARLGLMLALPPEKKATAVWIPSGIALAALLLLSHRVWPGVWLGAFLANLLDFFTPDDSFSLAAHSLVSAGIATGSTLQALTGRWLVRRWIGSENNPFDVACHAFAFAAAAMLACLIAATFGVASLYLGGFVPARAIGFTWWTWWLGDMTGVLTVGSFLLIWSRSPSSPWAARQLTEAVLLVLFLSVMGAVVFGILPLPTTFPPALPYLILPLLVWATFRFGQHGAVAALVLTSGLAVWGTAHCRGPFAQPTVPASLLLLQVFMGAIAVTVLVMAAVLRERPTAQQTLAVTQRHVNAVMQNMPDACSGFDRDWRYNYVNPQWETLFGKPAAEVVGRVIWELFPEVAGTPVEEHYRRAMRDRVAVTFEAFAPSAGCWTEVRVYPTDQGIASHVRDVSARHRAEEALSRSEQRYRALVQATPQVVWVIDEEGISPEAAAWWRETTGQSPQESVGWGWLQVLHPEDREPIRAAWSHCIETKSLYDREYRVRAPGGDYRHLAARGVALFGPEGCFQEWVGTLADVTDRKHAEEALRQSEERYRLLTEALEQRVEERTRALQASEQRFRSAFDHAPIGIALVAPDGRWLRANRSLCDIVGYSESELLTTDFQTITHPDDLDVDLGHVRDMLAGSIRTYQMEKRYFHKQGHVVHVLLSVSLVRDAEGAPLYFISQIKDVTQWKRAEEELRHAKEAAEAASRAKSEFLAVMSHEIRTPLNGVLGMTELALDTDLTPEQRDYLVTVRSSGEALLAVINDVLDFAKVEAGKLDLDPQPFRLRDTLEAMLRPLAVQAREKGLGLTSWVADSVPDELLGDAGRLRQVMLNLVGNAVKFTQRGHVAVRVEARPVAGTAEVELFVEVEDTGIGIAAEKLRAVFEPFTQADGSTTRRFGGTGLGLTISARLAALMGGGIEAHSEPGRGSTFRFTARLGCEEAGVTDGVRGGRDGEAIPPGRGRPLRVLLAEDNAVNQRVATAMLRREGHAVTLAGNGREAIEALARQPFDLVLMDVQMPDLDGLEAAAAIRRLERGTGRRVPILALTAHAMSGDPERCLAAGMDGCLTKPIRERELREALAACQPGQPVEGAAPDAEGAPPGPSEAGDDVFDAAGLRRRLGGDAELFAQILAIFPGECERLLIEMRDAIAQADAARLGRAAHTLKGTLGNLSAAAASGAALRLEAIAREEHLAEAVAAFATLETEVGRLHAALAELGSDLPS